MDVFRKYDVATPCIVDITRQRYVSLMIETFFISNCLTGRKTNLRSWNFAPTCGKVSLCLMDLYASCSTCVE